MTIGLRLLTGALLVIALSGKRWAYVAFMFASLLYFPAQVAFRIAPRACEMLVPMDLALHSFRNYAHELLFTIFFVVSVIHFSRRSDSRSAVLIKSAVGSLVYGVIIEIGEGISGHGHCRLRDLLPDSAGIVAGFLLVTLWFAMRGLRPGQGIKSDRI